MDDYLWSPAHRTPLKHVVDGTSGTVVFRDSLVCLKLTIINIFKEEVMALIWRRSLVLFLSPFALIWNVEQSSGFVCERVWRGLKLQLNVDVLNICIHNCITLIIWHKKINLCYNEHKSVTPTEKKVIFFCI